MNNPKISVVIPIYNAKPYIRECLDSVINQTYQNIEVICVNDHGNDGTIDIVKQYAATDSRIIVISNDKNMGLACSRNAGMDIITGDYLIFLDDDDYLQHDIVEKLLQSAVSTGSDVTISKTTTFADTVDEYINQRVLDIDNYLKFIPKVGYQVSWANFRESLKIVHCVAWGKLYKVDFIKRNNLRFANARIIHEDEGFNVKILSCFPLITWTNDIGVMYRIRQGSITHIIEQRQNVSIKAKNMKMALCDSFTFIKNSRDKFDAKKLIRYCKTSIYHPYCSVSFNPFFAIIAKMGEFHIRIFGVKIARIKVR